VTTKPKARISSVSEPMRKSIAAAGPTEVNAGKVADGWADEWNLDEPEIAEYVRIRNVPASYDPDNAPAALRHALHTSFDKGHKDDDGKFTAKWMMQKCRDADQAAAFIKEGRRYAKACDWTMYATHGRPIYDSEDQFTQFIADETGTHVRYSVRPFEARKPRK
jgi:hypothetical protein